jgi:hypothetical protein
MSKFDAGDYVVKKEGDGIIIMGFKINVFKNGKNGKNTNIVPAGLLLNKLDGEVSSSEDENKEFKENVMPEKLWDNLLKLASSMKGDAVVSRGKSTKKKALRKIGKRTRKKTQ